MPRLTHRAGGFVIREAVVVFVVLLIAVSLLLLAAGEVRRHGGLVEDEDKLRWHGQTTGLYANANDDRFWSFASTRVDEASIEATNIINRLRTDGGSMNPPSSWVPHILYNHLALADWLNLPLPDERFVSTGDEVLLNLHADPLYYGHGPTYRTLRFGTSFETPPAFWSNPWSGSDAISNAATRHNLYYIGSGVRFGAHRVGVVRFPGQKIQLHDSHGWHFPIQTPVGDRVPYYGRLDATLPLLFVDGSVRVLSTGETNRGWNPYAPASRSGVLFRYSPTSIEPPTVTGEIDEIVHARYRYTRGGLEGLDIGPESGEGLIRDVLPGRRTMR